MRRRTAFTITELLVSMALIVFIMSILAEAFVEGLKTFRSMKAIGDMNARLRTAAGMIKDDLIADHFDNKRRTSDLGFWLQGPPQEGFLRLWHGSPFGSATFFTEGNVDSIDSYYATDQWLHFTVKKRGNNRGNFYSATVPAKSPLLQLGIPDSRYQEAGVNVYNTQWAEITWYLRDNGGLTDGGQHLFTLFRRQHAVVPSTNLIVNNQIIDLNYQDAATGKPGGIAANQRPGYLEVSTSLDSTGKFLRFNSPRDLTIPERRFGFSLNPNVAAGMPYRSDKNLRYPIYAFSASPNFLPDDEDGFAGLGGNAAQSFEGTDVILTDVLSFVVIPIFSGVPTADIPIQNQYITKNFPGVGVYDTWSDRADELYDYTLWDNGSVPAADPHLVPCKQVLTGLQISVRVWDSRTQQARQITVVQDM
jgi:hypothetical protein